ncbi:hypothetical protein SCLARK_00975 [Spiroplasma clarkii]|uniref:hypothetical protein n=1 Tax=Spiroplasma clarkii TaxID=2139 RepID=UPI000B561A50|nr:hypothetical protein [Spiroplasma clarkii]ARU91573.1 hypothetical protein SCLARK_00975 [Spiroplasma clarkii]
MHIKNNNDRIILNEYERLFVIPEGTEQTLIRELHQFNRDFYEDKLPEHYILNFDSDSVEINSDYNNFYQNYNEKTLQQSNQALNTKKFSIDDDQTIDLNGSFFEKQQSSINDQTSLTLENMIDSNSQGNFNTVEITQADLNIDVKKSNQVIDKGLVDDELYTIDMVDDEDKPNKKLSKKYAKQLKKAQAKEKTDSSLKVAQELAPLNIDKLFTPTRQVTSRHSDLEDIINSGLNKKPIINLENEIEVESESEKQHELEIIKDHLDNGKYGRLNLSRPMSLTCARYMRRLENLKKDSKKLMVLNS